MAQRKKSTRSKQPMVREVTAKYETRSMAEVFWLAFKSLAPEDQGAFLERLLNDPEWYEEVADAVAAIEGRSEPSQPYEEYVEDLRRSGRL